MNDFITKKCFEKYYLRFFLRFIIGELKPSYIFKTIGFPDNGYFSAADFGCGSGYYSMKLVELNNCRVLYSLDKDDIRLDYIIKTSSKKKLSHKIEIIETDLSVETRLKSNSVNFGFCSFLLSELNAEGKKNFIKLCSESLTKGAVLYISDYTDCQNIKNLGIEHAFSKNDFAGLISFFPELQIYKSIINKYSQSYFLKKND